MTRRLLGYARDNGSPESVAGQREELAAAGCRGLWEEVAGSGKELAERAKLLAEARPGDVVVVSRLSRLGRSLSDVVATIEALRVGGLGLRTLNGWPRDAGDEGPTLLEVVAALAEAERELLAERTRLGRQTAVRLGKVMGAKPKLTAEREAMARRLINDGMPVSDVARELGVHTSTLSRHGITFRASLGRGPRPQPMTAPPGP